METEKHCLCLETLEKFLVETFKVTILSSYDFVSYDIIRFEKIRTVLEPHCNGIFANCKMYKTY